MTSQIATDDVVEVTCGADRCLQGKMRKVVRREMLHWDSLCNTCHLTHVKIPRNQ